MPNPNPIELLREEGRPFWQRLTSPRPMPMKWLVWGFVLLGFVLTAKSTGEAAISWMYIFRASDISGPGELAKWLWELRTGIPPVLASLDIIGHWITGDHTLTSVTFFRLGFIAMFVLGFSMFSRSPLRLGVSLGLAIVFLWAGVNLPAGKLQTYDIYFPVLFLLFIYSLMQARKEDASETQQRNYLILAGFLLSMAELMRPFVILILPLILWQVWLTAKKLPRKYYWYFLIPILLFSGGWHAKHLVLYGQVTWTNHTGYNMHRAWEDMVNWPPLEEEVPSQYETGPANINTEVHGRNSRTLRDEVMKSIWYRPGFAFVNVFKQTGRLFKPETRLYEHDPQHWIFGPYALAVWLAGLFLLFNTISIFFLFLSRKVPWRSIGDPEIILLIFTLFEIFVIVMGDSGEEARFLLSLLPFFVALPGMSFSWEIRKESVLSLSGKITGIFKKWNSVKIDE